MQGSIFGSLKCTAQMDNLPRTAYDEGKLLYKYKDSIEVPPLGMVDDMITMSKCGNDSLVTNTIVNSFTESKKLNLSENKTAYWEAK